MNKVAIGVFALIVWIVSNLSCSWLVGGNGFDLTVAKRYTLDKASQNIIRKINEPVSLKLYVSDNISALGWNYTDYVEYVIAILGQYQKQNPKNVDFSIVRLSARSLGNKQAENVGLAKIVADDEELYLGLSISLDEKERSIARLVPERRACFESDINRILLGLQQKQKNTIGVLSPEIALFNPLEYKKTWSLFDELALDYHLVSVSEKAPYIPLEIKVLIVLNPGNLSPLLTYSLDQYLMRGGKLVLLVDPYSEITHFYKGYPPQSSTNLVSLLKQWGVEYDYHSIVGSYGSALKIGEGITYPLWFYTSGGNYDKLHFRTAGSLDFKPKDGLTYEVLSVSPNDAGQVKSDILRYASKRDAVSHFRGENKQYNLALRVSGRFVSNYVGSYYEGTSSVDELPPFELLSNDKARLVVIADSDFVSDDAWALSSDVQNPVYGAVPYADNAEFMLWLINDLLNQEDRLPSVGYPKHFDSADIVGEIAKPMIAATESERDKLNTQYNQKRLEISELKTQMFGADVGAGIRYRQQLAKLEQQVKDSADALQNLNKKTEIQTKEAISSQIWLNIFVYPLMLILLVFGISFIHRRYRLGKTK